MFMEWNALRLLYVEAYGFGLHNLVMMDAPTIGLYISALCIRHLDVQNPRQ